MPSEWPYAIQFDIILESKYFLTKKILFKILSVKIMGESTSFQILSQDCPIHHSRKPNQLRHSRIETILNV